MTDEILILSCERYRTFDSIQSCLTVIQTFCFGLIIIEPPHDKNNKMVCAPSEDSDQPGHPPSLIRVFAVRMKEAWVLSYPLSAQRRLRSDWADAQADLSLRWAHCHFVGFVVSIMSTNYCIQKQTSLNMMYHYFGAFKQVLLTRQLAMAI